MKLFKRPCRHEWNVTHVSNTLREGDDRCCSRLCKYKCTKCGETKEDWEDHVLGIENLPMFDELVEVKWKQVVSGESTLTIPTPCDCRNCHLYRMMGGNYGECMYTNRQVPKNGLRPDWCPLVDIEEGIVEKI